MHVQEQHDNFEDSLDDLVNQMAGQKVYCVEDNLESLQEAYEYGNMLVTQSFFRSSTEMEHSNKHFIEMCKGRYREYMRYLSFVGVYEPLGNAMKKVTGEPLDKMSATDTIATLTLIHWIDGRILKAIDDNPNDF